jgi:hypothetical protein
MSRFIGPDLRGYRDSENSSSLPSRVTKRESRGIVVYRMPKRRPKSARKGLRFTVPLIRLVIPIDSLNGKLRARSMQMPSGLRLQTLRRLARIETPFADLLPAKASPATPDQIEPIQTQKKRSDRMPKPPATRARRAPSPRKKK